MNEKIRDKWLQEINIMFTLNHKNIVKALETPDDFKHYDPAVLVMEYCAGGDLRNVCADDVICLI